MDSVTYSFLLPVIKVDSGLGNRDRRWQAASFSTRLLQKNDKNHIKGTAFEQLMIIPGLW